MSDIYVLSHTGAEIDNAVQRVNDLENVETTLKTKGAEVQATVEANITAHGNEVSATVQSEVETKGAEVETDVKNAVQAKGDEVIASIPEDYTALVEEVHGKQNQLTFDSTPTKDSTNPVTSGGIYDALGGDVFINFVARSTVFNSDGSITATDSLNAKLVTTFGSSNIVETYTYGDITKVRTTTFSDSGITVIDS